jgi:hypothetical protein
LDPRLENVVLQTHAQKREALSAFRRGSENAWLSEFL